MSITAASSPRRGPTTTRGSLGASRSSRVPRRAGRSFPTGKDPMARSVYPRGGGELEKVAGQIEELRAPGRTPEQPLDTPGQFRVEGLAQERAGLPLRFRADARVGQPGGRRLGAHDPARGEIHLVADLEPVHVVAE